MAMLDSDFISHGSTPSVAKVAVSFFSVAAAMEAEADSSRIGASSFTGCGTGSGAAFLALIRDMAEVNMGAGWKPSSWFSSSASVESLLRF
jgi:hypothetical protein